MLQGVYNATVKYNKSVSANCVDAVRGTYGQLDHLVYENILIAHEVSSFSFHRSSKNKYEFIYLTYSIVEFCTRPTRSPKRISERCSFKARKQI